MQDQQPLTQSDLLTLLHETFLLGVSHFEKIDSTNTRSLAMLSSNEIVQTPHLVYAETQTGGRGRGSNRWWASAGSLTFSVVVDCAQLGLSMEQQMQLPLLTGMALLRSGKAVIPQGDFALKWPNDVYLSGRKLAGVLTEVPSHSPQPQQSGAVSQLPRHAVIGVGLNVNNQFADAPTDLRAIGIAMSDVSGQSHNRVEILASFLRHLDELIQSSVGGIPVLSDWPNYCLLTGKPVTLGVGNTEVSGICQGIDPTGALLIETSQGQKRFVGGVVKAW